MCMIKTDIEFALWKTSYRVHDADAYRTLPSVTETTEVLKLWFASESGLRKAVTSKSKDIFYCLHGQTVAKD